jgi:two-component system, NtrC family, sensor kinase
VTVSAYGVKTKIFVNLFLLLLLAMGLIVFVMTVTLQKEFIRVEVAKADLVINSLAAAMVDGKDPAADRNARMAARLGRLRQSVSFKEVVVLSSDRSLLHVGQDPPFLRKDLEKMARATLQTRIRSTRFSGRTWGVFWQHDKYLMVAAPLLHGTSVVGAAATAFPLESAYRTLRSSQKIILVYIFINAAIFGLIGLQRMQTIAVKPVDRLLKRAEAYDAEDEFFFLYETGQGEINRLSRALNRMLQRIADDKETLQRTVESLERTNIDLRKAHKDIIQAEKLASVGRLSSGIAHEIGNPIGIVIGYLELLRQDDLRPGERLEYIARAEDEINRISGIIRQLLDFSRPASGETEAVSVHRIMEEIVDAVKVQPLMADVEVRFEFEAENDRVVSDPNQLRQVFLNLVINAADAIASGDNAGKGLLIIRSKEIGEAVGGETGYLRLTFIDNGPGIPAENLENIFDPFFTTKEPGKGTGLGLSVCFMILEKMGGRIIATSDTPEGTTMTIDLPLASPEDLMEFPV